MKSSFVNGRQTDPAVPHCAPAELLGFISMQQSVIHNRHINRNHSLSKLAHFSQAHSAVTYRRWDAGGQNEDKWLVIYHPVSFSAPLLFKQATASRETRIITNHSTFSFCPHWDTFVTTVTLISPPVHHRSPTKLNLRGRAAFGGSFNPLSLKS